MLFLQMIKTLTVEERVKSFADLGEWFSDTSSEAFEILTQKAINGNSWFTPSHIQQAFQAWSEVLTTDKMEQWLQAYTFANSPKKVGLVLAGNVPLVGFHDVLSTLISGHQALVKCASQDAVLIKATIDALAKNAPHLAKQVLWVDRLTDFDAVIATGSDNTSRYFEYYFAQHPHIIRKNRVSVAILNGKETAEEIKQLGKDIFTYYGLGCRNVAKIYVPEEYDLTQFIPHFDTFEQVLDHHKYRNNYDYNKSIYLVNREQHLDNGFLLFRETKDLVSPISVLFVERYKSEAQLSLNLAAQQDKIQCIVSQNGTYAGSLPFGQAQQPELWDYADGIDTLDFLSSL